MIRFVIRFETRVIRFLGLFERINRVYPFDTFGFEIITSGYLHILIFLYFHILISKLQQNASKINLDSAKKL